MKHHSRGNEARQWRDSRKSYYEILPRHEREGRGGRGSKADSSYFFFLSVVEVERGWSSDSAAVVRVERKEEW